jgi:hypothetical protein
MFGLRGFGLAFLLFLSVRAPSRAGVWLNEFVAENRGGATNSAGEAADWIELYNDAAEPVDLGGWFLTDKESTPAKWRIPDGTSITSNGYLLVFADSSDVSFTNGELHANFSLSKDGEYLGLIRPDGATAADAFSPVFPEQYEDVSYGRTTRQTDLVGAASPGRYRVPNAAGTAPWTNAVGALGCAGTNSAFTVRYYEMNTSIASIDAAEVMAANGAYWKTDRAYPVVAPYATIDFHESSSSGYFTNNELFPNHTAGQDKSYFVVVADTSIYVPQGDQWTFCVGSDDGFRLRVSGQGVNVASEYTTGRGFGNTLATFTFPAAGVYSLTLSYYENEGGATVEFSAAQGYQSAFAPGTFRLVGDPAGGLLHAGAIGSAFETDVSKAMRGVNARLDAEWPFSLSHAPAAGEDVTLYMRCADGFSASLNGTPLASLNLPAPLLWNSAATAARPLTNVLQWLAYSVPAAAFAAGSNTLAVTGLNDSATNADFLLQPRLVWRSAERFPCFFKAPTPGAANGHAFTAPTPKVVASVPRGYKREPFAVSLACEGATNAAIRYTVDGSTPWTNSLLYAGPLAVTNTTVLRAAVIDPDSLRMTVRTFTWLFPEDILQQGASAPNGWPASGQVNGQSMEYGLRAATVAGDPVRIRNGLTNAIPSISLVTDLTNLFSATSGIYVNPGNDGLAWERPVSVELIDPVRGTNHEFRIDAGLRIRGAFSRTTGNPKHAFRLFFRSGYGESALKFKLFDDEGAGEFEKIDLRCSQNHSWSYEGSAQETFVRETFSRDAQREMGMPYARSRYYHLYLNGQYWGLYQTEERPDADFASTYLGGDAEDWDCIKTTQPGYTTTASDGTFDAFYALHDIAINQGFAGAYSNNYWRVRGLNPNGTANTNYPAYLDQDNLIAFMLTAYYTGDPDSPISVWGGFPNNMFGLFNRKSPSGFTWVRHDAEHSLGAIGSFDVNCDTTGAGADFTAQSLFNPATLHQRLCQHPDYRLHFADLVRRHLFGNGPLAPTNAQSLFRSRMSEIDLAIIVESARWGRGLTRDATWLPACNTVLNTYLNQRRDIIVSHFRNRGWYPWLDAPSYSTTNATVASGYTLRVSATNAFYFTTDGTDPRLPGGGLSPSAIAVTQTVGQAAQPVTLVARGAAWRYFDRGFQPPSTNSLPWSAASYPDAAWSQGSATLGFAGSATVNPVATVTRRYTNGVSGTQVTTTYFRRTFTLASTNGVSGLSLEILRDDGAVVYLNGAELLRENMAAGAISYGAWSAAIVGSPDQNTYFTRAVSASLLRAGTNTLAVEVHQCNEGSSDLYFDLSLATAVDAQQTATHRADLTVTNSLTVLARAANGSDWSPLAEVDLAVLRAPVDYSPLRVSELMYAPPAPAVGSPYVNDDFAWLELRNTGATALDLGGIRFATGITHTFAPFALAPGTRLVLAKNLAAFATRYATNALSLTAWSSGNLARKGEALSLVDPDGTNILTFTYSTNWYPGTYDTGRSLVAVDLAAAEPLWSTAANWRPSRSALGSPGLPDAPRFAAAALAGDTALSLSAEGLEGLVEIWCSEDLATWVLCPPSTWSRQGDSLTVDLLAPALPPSSKRFFQLRIRD